MPQNVRTETVFATGFEQKITVLLCSGKRLTRANAFLKCMTVFSGRFETPMFTHPGSAGKKKERDKKTCRNSPRVFILVIANI